MARLWWWGRFLLDVALCTIVAAIAGLIFGVYALREDVRFAWRRPLGS